MDKADILEKIKSFFFAGDEEKEKEDEEEKDEAINLEGTDWKSGDKIIRVEGDVVTGTTVKEVTEIGLETLLDGEYVIDDAGITLVILDGVIDSITEDEIVEETVEVEAEVEETPEEMPVVEGDAGIADLKEEIGMIIKEVAEEILTELEAVKAENIELKARFETFADQDCSKSVTEGKEKKVKFEDKYEKLKYYGKR